MAQRAREVLMSTPDAGTDPVAPETDVTFESGTERLNALLARPDLAEEVAARREELRRADRQHAMGLAMIRQAADLTQTELAEGGCQMVCVTESSSSITASDGEWWDGDPDDHDGAGPDGGCRARWAAGADRW
jgi:hypothetical protein